MNYLKNIALGSAVLAFMKWLENPENQEKLENFGNFIVENLPIIFGGLAAILALNIGAKLMAFLGVLKGIAIGLGPALAAIAAAALIWKGGQEGGKAVQDFIDRQRGGGPTTSPESGRTYDYKTIQGMRQYLGGLLQKTDPRTNWFGVPEEYKKYQDPEVRSQIEAQLQQLSELEKRMEMTKSLNDDLDRARENVKKQKEKIDKMKSSGASEDKIKKEEEYLKTLQKYESTFVTNLKASRTKQHKLFENIDLESLDPDIVDLLPDELRKSLADDIKKNKQNQSQREGGGQGIQGVQGADYDVIIPLDHAKKAGSVADDPSGTSFGQSNSTGADGREREHQDRAAQKLKSELEKQGIRVKIVTPEEHGNYQDYDKFIRSQSEKGVRVVPLHFDAITEGGGVGFLTRTRAGDQADAEFAAPIQQALADFQKKNPDLGNLGQDTTGNATVNQGAASPTALIELGEMVRWEQKHGKNFTDSPEFMELIRGVAGGIGKNFGDAPTPAQLSPDQDKTAPPPPPAQRVSFIPLDGTQPGASPVIASSHASQDTPSVFSPSDPNDSSSLLNRSIYNAPVV
jgi:hypothetical protein